MSELPEGSAVRSAVVWFRGYPESSEFFETAAAAGGFVMTDYVPASMPRHVWPAAIETVWVNGDRPELLGVRVGVDIERGCWVVDVPGGNALCTRRVLLNLRGGMAAVHIARIAAGQALSDG